MLCYLVVSLERVLLSISAQLDRLMERYGLTQRALARRCGRRQHSTVRTVLKGQDMKLSTLVTLADAVRCDVVITLVPRRAPSDISPRL